MTEKVACNHSYHRDPRQTFLEGRINEEVSKLPATQRVVIQSQLKGTSVAKIAANRGVTPQAIYELIGKAHGQLKVSLKPLWEEYLDIQSTRRMQNSKPRRHLASSGEDTSA